MYIAKPMSMGLLVRSFEQRRRRYFAVSSFAFFDLADPSKLLSDQIMWPFVMEALGSEALFDVGMPKPQGEVVVVGKAMAAGGAPVSAMDFGFGVFRDEKRLIGRRLRAYGDRMWTRDRVTGAYARSDPTPFTEMPVGYPRAFGGEGYDRNPVGRGISAKLLADHDLPSPVPNVVNPREDIASVFERPEPASLMPIDLTWPQRQARTGTYDKTYLKTAFPGLPGDFDWSHFNVTHPDQWLPEFFQAEDEVTVVGMNADHPTIRFRLPQIRPRSLLRLRQDGRSTMRELTLRNETLWLFPNDMRGVLVSRALTGVAEPDGDDVEVVLLAYESLAAPPRDIAHYVEVIRLRTDPETRHLHMLNESQVTPELDPAEKARREAARLAKWNEAMAQMTGAMAAAATEMVDEARSRFGNPIAPVPIDAAMFQPDILEPIPLPTDEDVAALDIDLVGITEALKKLEERVAVGPDDLEKGKEKAKALLAEAEKLSGGVARDPDADLAKLTELARRKVEGPDPIDGLEPVFDVERLVRDKGVELPEALGPEQRASLAAQLEDAHASMRDIRRTSPKPATTGEPAPESVGRLVGSLVLTAHAEGRSMAERDLADARLENAELEGIDLTKAMLERADLRGADLRGAKCAGATFCGAQLAGADLTGADLTEANLCEADLTEANLSGAVLTDAKMTGTKAPGAFFQGATLHGLKAMDADFAGARFPEAEMHRAEFVGCAMADASFIRAVLEKALFVNVDLTNADLLEATVIKARLINIRAERARLNGARLDEALISPGSTLKDGAVRGTSLRKAGLHGVVLAGCSMDRSVLDGADLGDADLTGASLRRASLVAAMLVGADLTDADLSHADLNRAMLRKAVLTRTSLEKANLYEAEFLDARTEETVVRKANVTATKLAL